MSPAQVAALVGAKGVRIILADDLGIDAVADRYRFDPDELRGEFRKLMGNMYRAAGVRACKLCGCTDEEGCESVCFWSLTGEDLCLQCEDADG